MHPCFKEVTLKHKSGCKIGQLSGLWEWATQNEWYISIPAIIIGLAVCFAGIIMIKTVYLASGVILTVAVVWFVLYTTVLQNNNQNWMGWVVFLGSILVGLIVGFVFIKFQKLGAFFLGTIGGFGFGILLFNAGFYLLNS